MRPWSEVGIVASPLGQVAFSCWRIGNERDSFQRWQSLQCPMTSNACEVA